MYIYLKELVPAGNGLPETRKVGLGSSESAGEKAGPSFKTGRRSGFSLERCLFFSGLRCWGGSPRDGMDPPMPGRAAGFTRSTEASLIQKRPQTHPASRLAKSWGTLGPSPTINHHRWLLKKAEK